MRVESVLSRAPGLTHLSKRRLAATAGLLSAIALAGSFAPRWIVFAEGDTQEPQPVIEVLSVKPNLSPSLRFSFSPVGSRHFKATNVTAEILVSGAFELDNFQIQNLPTWADKDKYDVEATLRDPLTLTGMRPLFQNVLRDRFHAISHFETKDGPVYFLTVTKSGSKLRPAPCASEPSPANPCGAFSGSLVRGAMMGRSSPVEQLADALTRTLKRTVIDRTGLRGTYDFDMTWTPDTSMLPFGPPPTADPSVPGPQADGPSLFTALEEQLGLRLESWRGATSVLIVDQLEQPDAN